MSIAQHLAPYPAAPSQAYYYEPSRTIVSAPHRISLPPSPPRIPQKRHIIRKKAFIRDEMVEHHQNHYPQFNGAVVKLYLMKESGEGKRAVKRVVSSVSYDDMLRIYHHPSIKIKTHSAGRDIQSGGSKSHVETLKSQRIDSQTSRRRSVDRRSVLKQLTAIPDASNEPKLNVKTSVQHREKLEKLSLLIKERTFEKPLKRTVSIERQNSIIKDGMEYSLEPLEEDSKSMKPSLGKRTKRTKEDSDVDPEYIIQQKVSAESNRLVKSQLAQHYIRQKKLQAQKKSNEQIAQRIKNQEQVAFQLKNIEMLRLDQREKIKQKMAKSRILPGILKIRELRKVDFEEMIQEINDAGEDAMENEVEYEIIEAGLGKQIPFIALEKTSRQLSESLTEKGIEFGCKKIGPHIPAVIYEPSTVAIEENSFDEFNFDVIQISPKISPLVTRVNNIPIQTPALEILADVNLLPKVKIDKILSNNGVADNIQVNQTLSAEPVQEINTVDQASFIQNKSYELKNIVNVTNSISETSTGDALKNLVIYPTQLLPTPASTSESINSNRIKSIFEGLKAITLRQELLAKRFEEDEEETADTDTITSINVSQYRPVSPVNHIRLMQAFAAKNQETANAEKINVVTSNQSELDIETTASNVIKSFFKRYRKPVNRTVPLFEHRALPRAAANDPVKEKIKITKEFAEDDFAPLFTVPVIPDRYSILNILARNIARDPRIMADFQLQSTPKKIAPLVAPVTIDMESVSELKILQEIDFDEIVPRASPLAPIAHKLINSKFEIEKVGKKYCDEFASSSLKDDTNDNKSNTTGLSISEQVISEKEESNNTEDLMYSDSFEEDVNTGDTDINIVQGSVEIKDNNTVLPMATYSEEKFKDTESIRNSENDQKPLHDEPILFISPHCSQEPTLQREQIRHDNLNLKETLMGVNGLRLTPASLSRKYNLNNIDSKWAFSCLLQYKIPMTNLLSWKRIDALRKPNMNLWRKYSLI